MDEMFSSYFLNNTEEDRIAMLKAIFYSMTDGVVVADKDMRFILWNPAATQMIGLGMTDDPNWSYHYGCYHEDGTPYKNEDLPLAKTIRGIVVINEMVLIKNTKKPQGVWLSVNGSPISSGGGVVVMRDVTTVRTITADLCDLTRKQAKLLKLLDSPRSEK